FLSLGGPGWSGLLSEMLQDYEEPVSQPKQSGSFKYLQGILEGGDGGKYMERFCNNRKKKSAVKTDILNPIVTNRQHITL
uniref:PDZ and LIM domain-containing protein n=1 Tax=Neogobius melanostomus TaxID=47308 RepID=A0A8C6WQJ1_9GOBI